MMHHCHDFIPAKMEGRLARAWRTMRETEELAQAGLTPAAAARMLGIRPQAMWDRIRVYGIRFPASRRRGPYRKRAGG